MAATVDMHPAAVVDEELKATCTKAGADYAIRWGLDSENNEFYFSSSYNPPERVAALLERRGDTQTYCTRSKYVKLPLDGNSLIARVYKNGGELFFNDFNSDIAGDFVRSNIAKEFEIQSIGFIKEHGGVTEYGTTKTWSVLPQVLSNKTCVQEELLAKKFEDEGENPAAKQKLSRWEPENEEFWQTWGSKIAFKNLWISIPNLCLAFATWIMWSIMATVVQKAHDVDSSAFPFADLGLDPADKKAYKAMVFMLPSIAGLAGATLRVSNTFMVAATGGQVPNAMNSTLTIIPMLGIGLAFASSDVPFWLLCILAPACGFGGGAFASSMSGISFFFPKKKQGLALGLNAGIGNLGVSLTQLALPIVTGSAMFGGDDIGGKFPKNAGWFYVILLACAALPAWALMNYMPNHGSEKGSTLQNVLAYLRLQGCGFTGVAVGVGLFIATNPFVKGSPALMIGRIFVLAFIACTTTLTALWFLSSAAIKAKLRVQSVIFKDKHTWLMTWLYIMTFGSFIGYSSSFPKIIKDVFGYLPNGDINPNAPNVNHFAWMGACVGSLSRPVGGWLSDKWTGATVTHWGTIIETISTVLVGIFVRLAMDSETPETYFYPFLICFLFLFGSTGSSNGSTFRQMSVMFPPEKAGPVLGWTSAVAAYGAAVFPACFGAGLKGDFVDIVLYVFAAYYATCLFVNYWYYYRSGCEKPC